VTSSFLFRAVTSQNKEIRINACFRGTSRNGAHRFYIIDCLGGFDKIGIHPEILESLQYSRSLVCHSEFRQVRDYPGGVFSHQVGLKHLSQGGAIYFPHAFYLLNRYPGP
jgi:hypothetical protein